MSTSKKIIWAFSNVPLAIAFFFAISFGAVWAFAPLALLIVLYFRLGRRFVGGWKPAMSTLVWDLQICFGLALAVALVMDSRVSWVVPAFMAGLALYLDTRAAYDLIKGRALPGKFRI